ncbi:MAG: hypothetical protein IPM47_20685 [Sphingobacteriales bacterium]|nr:MAG: hypothetical protein IPM47_20685 [Sphingobacteriales bacterium]
MKKAFVVLVLVLAGLSIQAQENSNLATAPDQEETIFQTVEIQKNTFFAEVGGNGTLYSVNIDQVLLAGHNFKISTRIGMGLSSSVFEKDIDPIIPIEGNIWFGKNKHHFETGMGVVAAFGFDETPPATIQITENGTKVIQYQSGQEYTSLYAFTRIGYRYQNSNGGLFFRAGITPTVTAYSKVEGANPKLEGSISIGYTFKSKKPAQIPVINYN